MKMRVAEQHPIGEMVTYEGRVLLFGRLEAFFGWENILRKGHARHCQCRYDDYCKE
jgi:hypothetical protein